MGIAGRRLGTVALVAGLLVALVGCGGGGTLTAGSSSDSGSTQTDGGSSDRARSTDHGSTDDTSTSKKKKKKSNHSSSDSGGSAGGSARTTVPTSGVTTGSTGTTGAGTSGGTATDGGTATGGVDPNAGTAGGDPQVGPTDGTAGGAGTGGNPGDATTGGGGATTGVGHDGLPLDLTNPFEVGRQWVLSANDGDFADVDRFSCRADATAVAAGEQHQASLAALRQMVATGFAPRDATTGYLQVNRLDLRTGISSDVTTPMIVEDGVWKVCYYPQYS